LPYSIDTSALLDGWVRYYPPDVFPPVWDRIRRLVGQGVLIATEEVLHELQKKDDGIYKWAKDNDRMFVPLDVQIQVEASRILTGHPRLVDTRRERSGADPFVIALAKVRSCPVVTGEARTGNPLKPHIPDVCSDLGVRCLSLLELFRELGWQF